MAAKKTESELTSSDRTAARRFRVLECVVNICDTSGNATYSAICRDMGITGSTVHGDLAYLVSRGLIEKPGHDSYRGIRSTSERVFSETNYGDRRRKFSEIKKAVARGCVRHMVDGYPILDNKVCFISQGTSTEPLFSVLRDSEAEERPNGIVTNSLPGFLELLDFDPIELSIIGGKPDRQRGAIFPPDRQFAGDDPESESSPRQVSQKIDFDKQLFGAVDFDLAIISCSSITPDGNVSCNDQMASFRRSLLKIIANDEKELVVLADATKCKRTDSGTLITNIEWDQERTWLFVDGNPKGKTAKIYKEFRKKIGDRFVEISADSADGDS